MHCTRAYVHRLIATLKAETECPARIQGRRREERDAPPSFILHHAHRLYMKSRIRPKARTQNKTCMSSPSCSSENLRLTRTNSLIQVSKWAGQPERRPAASRLHFPVRPVPGLQRGVRPPRTNSPKQKNLHALYSGVPLFFEENRALRSVQRHPCAAPFTIGVSTLCAEIRRIR